MFLPKVSFRLLTIIALALAASGLKQTAQAKDLSHRLGLGYRNSYAFDLPSLSIQYYPNMDYGLISALGIDTQDQNSRFAFSFGVRKIIFREENMNFFFNSVAAILNQDNGIEKKSGFELSATAGGEFFLTGLDSLGFNFETGVAVSNIDKVRFRTVGDSFVRSGIVFYF